MKNSVMKILLLILSFSTTAFANTLSFKLNTHSIFVKQDLEAVLDQAISKIEPTLEILGGCSAVEGIYEIPLAKKDRADKTTVGYELQIEANNCSNITSIKILNLDLLGSVGQKGTKLYKKLKRLIKLEIELVNGDLVNLDLYY